MRVVATTRAMARGVPGGRRHRNSLAVCDLREYCGTGTLATGVQVPHTRWGDLGIPNASSMTQAQWAARFTRRCTRNAHAFRFAALALNRGRPDPTHRRPGMHRSILIVDDDPAVQRTLALLFQRHEWRVLRAADGASGIDLYEREFPDLVLLDVHMPGLKGTQVLHVLRDRDPDATVLMLTGHADVPMAVEAMQAGAEAFLEKPISVDHLLAAAERAWEKASLRRYRRLAEAQRDDRGAIAALGQSPVMRQLANQLRVLATGSAPILLTGETGTGKGWAARTVHEMSPRAKEPFVAINCAGLSATFLDTELFGHAKGAFTDAKTAKQGLFEVANGGTIFLDEIGDLAPELQPKLLTVLETRRFRRLGETRETEVDVRLIAATHHDLAAAVRAGRFREDLYFRLAVLPVHLPPLRARGREEILALAHRLLDDLRKSMIGPSRISTPALELLAQHSWPGNIRELRNVLERAVLFAGDGDELRPEHLPAELRSRDAVETMPSGDLSLASAERLHILRVLAHFDDNRAQAARALGMTRGTLYKRLREYGIHGAPVEQADDLVQPRGRNAGRERHDPVRRRR